MITLERDRFNAVFWSIRRNGKAVRRGRGELRAWFWLAWERRRDR